MREITSSHDVENLLLDALWDSADEQQINDVRSFESEGVMTSNSGLVLVLEDGSKYQITIVRER